MAHLTDGFIAAIVEKISTGTIQLLAILYMDTSRADIEDIKVSSRDDVREMKRTILRRWRNSKQGSVQQLADLLHKMKIMKLCDIKKYFDVKNVNEIEDRKPEMTDEDINEWEMAKIVLKLDNEILQDMIRNENVLSEADFTKFKRDNPGNINYETFEILYHWSQNVDGTRHKMVEMMKIKGIDDSIINDLLL